MGSAVLHGLVFAGFERYAGIFPGGAGRVGAAQAPGFLHVSFRILDQAASLPAATPPGTAAGLAHAVRPGRNVAGSVLPILHDYFPLRELDRRPVPLRPIRPVTDETKTDGVEEGYVTLRLLINERGEVDKALLLESDPLGAFEDSALEAFSKARFRPGERRGEPVRSQVVIRVRYSRNPESNLPQIPALRAEKEMPR